jgi:hypothetical protein
MDGWVQVLLDQPQYIQLVGWVLPYQPQYIWLDGYCQPRYILAGRVMPDQRTRMGKVGLGVWNTLVLPRDVAEQADVPHV